jgi:hypothetical protein
MLAHVLKPPTAKRSNLAGLWQLALECCALLKRLLVY